MKGKFKSKTIMILIIIILVMVISLIIRTIYISNVFYKEKSHVKDINKSKKNNDTAKYKTVGWLDVDGTNMNMPVYLSKSDNTDYSVIKEKFAWTNNTSGKLDNFMVILGHNVLNLGIPSTNKKSFNRFEELMGYVYEDFANEHKYFQYTNSEKEYIYKIFSVSIITPADLYFYPTENISKKDLEEYIAGFSRGSIYKYDIDVNGNDKIMTLITCTKMFNSGKDNYEIAVTGRLVRDKEKLTNYSMKKSKKYSMIDKALKGDGSNEKN